MCVTWPWPPGPGVTLSLRLGCARGVARGVAGPGLTECFMSSATSPSRARMSLFRPLNMSTCRTTTRIRVNKWNRKKKETFCHCFCPFPWLDLISPQKYNMDSSCDHYETYVALCPLLRRDLAQTFAPNKIWALNIWTLKIISLILN